MTAAAGIEDLSRAIRDARTWSAYEDSLLALIVRLFEERPTTKRDVDVFMVKAAVWGMPTEESLSNERLLSLHTALESLEKRGLLEFETMSGGYFHGRPTTFGREFADELRHAEWISIFDRRIASEHLDTLTRLYELSFGREDDVPVLQEIQEQAFIPVLRSRSDGTEPTYEERVEAERLMESLVEAGFVWSFIDRARPTYAGCVRIEQSRPLVLFADAVGPLELALGNDSRFAGALRKLREAQDQASERPFPKAEDAIKNATSAVEAAFAVITEKHVDLSAHAEILRKRGILSRELLAVVQKLDVWRGATAGIAHGGGADPVVDAVDAQLAVHFAAGLIAYVVARIARMNA